jgi:hypothetical protein
VGKAGTGKFQECWNSWGPDDVVTNKGLQSSALKNMLDRLMAKPTQPTKVSKPAEPNKPANSSTDTSLTVSGNDFAKKSNIIDNSNKKMDISSNKFESASTITFGLQNMILII